MKEIKIKLYTPYDKACGFTWSDTGLPFVIYNRCAYFGLSTQDAKFKKLQWLLGDYLEGPRGEKAYYKVITV